MALDFAFWHQQFQNGFYTSEKNYNIFNKSYLNVCLGIEYLIAFHKDFYTAKK